MKLKACGIRNILENYENIDFLGFNFINYSKRKIDKFQAKKISENLLKKGYKNIKKVGLFDEKFSLKEILEIMDFAKLDSIQLYSDNLEIFKKLKNKGFFVIKPISIEKNELDKIKKYEEFIDLYIIDGKNPGSGKGYDYSKINNLNLEKKFLVAGGVNEKNVLEIFEIFKNNKNFYGIDLASGVDNGENIDLEKIKKIVNLIK